MNDQKQGGGFGLGALFVAATFGFFLARGCERVDLIDPKPPVVDPVKDAKLGVVVVYESETPFPGLGPLRTDKAFHDALKAKGHVWRMVDKDAVGEDGNPPADVAPLLADAKGRPLPRLYLIDLGTRKTVYAGDLPDVAASLDPLTALIRKHGG